LYQVSGQTGSKIRKNCITGKTSAGPTSHSTSKVQKLEGRERGGAKKEKVSTGRGKSIRTLRHAALLSP